MTTIAEAFEKCKRTFQAGRTLVSLRYAFRECTQRVDENIEQFASRLQDYAADCGFQEMEQELLRDQLICGLRDPKIKETLLMQANLDFDRAYYLAQVQERAMREAAALKDKTEGQEINRVESRGSQRFKCTRCGGPHRTEDKRCRAQGKTCFTRGKQGHLARYCRSKKNQSSLNEISENNLIAVNRVESELIETEIKIQGTPVKMLVDTGSKYSIIPRKVWKNLKTKMRAEPTIKLTAYSGDKVPVLGSSEVQLQKNGLSVRTKLLIVQEGTCILGLADIEKLEVMTLKVAALSSRQSVEELIRK